MWKCPVDRCPSYQSAVETCWNLDCNFKLTNFEANFLNKISTNPVSLWCLDCLGPWFVRDVPGKEKRIAGTGRSYGGGCSRWCEPWTRHLDLLPPVSKYQYTTYTKLVGGLEHGLICPHIGNNHPNWLSYFSKGLKPPTRKSILMDQTCWGWLHRWTDTCLPTIDLSIEFSPLVAGDEHSFRNKTLQWNNAHCWCNVARW